MAIIGFLVCWVSAPAVAKQWICNNPNNSTSQIFRNSDPTGAVRQIAIANTAIFIVFRDQDQHDAFVNAVGSRYPSAFSRQRHVTGPTLQYAWFDDQAYAGGRRNIEAWTFILMQVHAIDPLTVEAMTAFDRFIGTTLPRQGAEHETLEDWVVLDDTQAAAAAVATPTGSPCVLQ